MALALVMHAERKFLPAASADLAVKASEEGKPVVIAGYASRFGGEPDSYGDVIAPGAYAATIRAWNSRAYALPLLYQHGDSVIGKWVALREDAKGLWAEGELTPGHSVASDVAASVRHGALSGLSIGFRCKSHDRDPSTSVRTLHEIDLVEISAVANPACVEARIEAIKAMTEGDSGFGPNVAGAMKHLRKARAALAPHCKAGGPMQDACQAAHARVGSAMGELGHPPGKGAQMRELREFFRDAFGWSRREAEDQAVIVLAKARLLGAGDGDGTGELPPADETSREGQVGAGLLSAILAVRHDLVSRTPRS